MLYAILALVSAILAVVSFLQYTGSNDNKLFLGAFIVFVIATIALGALFLSGKVNQKEDIHITE